MDNRYTDRSTQGDDLLLAAWSGDLFEVGQLLGGGVDPNTRDSEGWTALHYAITHSSKPLAECLLRAGADPDAVVGNEGLPALSYAISERRDGIVDLLIEAGASANSANGSFTPLMAAVSVQDPLLAQRLLDRGADPNAARTVLTPLILAIISNQLDCVSILLRGG